jgi:hypothetical protein
MLFIRLIICSSMKANKQRLQKGTKHWIIVFKVLVKRRGANWYNESYDIGKAFQQYLSKWWICASWYSENCAMFSNATRCMLQNWLTTSCHSSNSKTWQSRCVLKLNNYVDVLLDEMGLISQFSSSIALPTWWFVLNVWWK